MRTLFVILFFSEKQGLTTTKGRTDPSRLSKFECASSPPYRGMVSTTLVPIGSDTRQSKLAASLSRTRILRLYETSPLLQALSERNARLAFSEGTFFRWIELLLLESLGTLVCQRDFPSFQYDCCGNLYLWVLGKLDQL